MVSLPKLEVSFGHHFSKESVPHRLFLSDPSGEGNGGESVWGLIEGKEKRFFEAEYQPKIRHSEPGLLSMVSLGDNLVGSQFFFTLGSDLTSLDGVHCVIGQAVEGLEVLRLLNEAICDTEHRPYKDIRITHTVILEDPFENPRGFKQPSRSPSPTPERLRNGRIAADEDIDDASGKTEAEVNEMLAEREAKARATILEIVGDLPDADVAPPENVLFVCKLNPVTTDDDLEIIFSRFGKVVGCEVIRDRSSGDSLQYAFVEFEDRKSCEAAYFKMDNVLIDDRRIHVDFSQSVSKFQWRGKGRGLIVKDGSKDNKLDFNNYKDAPNRAREGNGRQQSDSNGRRRQFSPRRRSPASTRRSRSPQRGNRRSRSPPRRPERTRSPATNWQPANRNRNWQSNNGSWNNNYRRPWQPQRYNRHNETRQRSRSRSRDRRRASPDRRRQSPERSTSRRLRTPERSRDAAARNRNRDEPPRRRERSSSSSSSDESDRPTKKRKSKKSKKGKKSKKSKKSAKKRSKRHSSDSSSSSSDSATDSSS